MARLLNGILGHHAIIERLLAAKSHGRLAQGYLFVGPSGIGKKATALALSQALLCEKIPVACGLCGPCLRLASGNSESLLEIAPEKNLIKIDQIRRVLDFLSLRSLTPKRAVIIDQAHQMNPQSANSLLKILEEPPEGTYFFLIAPSPEHVLPTIRSRCQVVSFAPLSEEDIRKKSTAPEWAIKASYGSFERLAMLTEPDELALRQKAIEILQKLKSDAWSYLDPELKNAFRDRGEAIRISQYMSFLLRDCVYFQMGKSERILNADQMNLFAMLSEVAADDLIQTGQRAQQMENAILQNRDVALIFEEFWLKTTWRNPEARTS